MRTTLSVEEPLDQHLREVAAQRKIPYCSVINQALRLGLEVMNRRSHTAKPFRVKPHRGGFQPGVDPEKLNQIVDDLETDDFSQESHP